MNGFDIRIRVLELYFVNTDVLFWGGFKALRPETRGFASIPDIVSPDNNIPVSCFNEPLLERAGS